jgi:hypothetical protein
MNKRYWIFARVVAVFAAAVWFMEPLLLSVLAAVPLFWIGIPLVLLALIRLITALRSGNSTDPAVRLFSAVAAVGCFFGLAIPANGFFRQRAVAAAKEYPAQVAPLLEAYRQTQGSYPASLDQLPARPAVPRLLRNYYGYNSEGGSYSFRFSPRLGHSWEYDGTTKTWRLST